MTAAAARKAELYQTIKDYAHVLTDAQVLLLCQILDYDGGEGCWASAATLADDLAWSETKIHNNLRSLHAKGFYSTQYARGGSRAFRVINWPTLTDRHGRPWRHQSTATRTMYPRRRRSAC